ncbi:MAG: DUF4349 domain-containing protein [Clostridiales bacterium]|nr:DUF4349 domain-containing protein [Clostridiales bacterium]
MMECKEFLSLLDAYLEGTLQPDDMARMRAHERECPACAGEAQLRRDCLALSAEAQMPEEFSSSWRKQIREEKQVEKRNVVDWKKWIAAAAAMVFVVGGTLLTRDKLNAVPENGAPVMMATYKRTAENSYALGANMDYALDTVAEEAAGVQEEKIIRTASFTIKTTDYDQDLSDIQALCESVGGRMEYLYTSGDRENDELFTASLTLRVPSAKLDEFLSGAQGIGKMTSRHESVEDVSDSYYDVQARLEIQLQKMERLQALLQAAENVSDLIEIESSIADTQYQIDRYQGQLQNYDSRIDYSTVHVTVQEIRAQESEEAGFGERIAAGLKNSIENGLEFVRDMAVFLISVAPWLLCVGGIGVLAAIAMKKIRKKKK